MNFTQLRCFITVSDNLSFTVAARKLNFSQSAISKNINDLEKELKTQLLVRNPHQIALTTDGIYFYNVALNILKEKDAAIANIKNIHQEKSFRDIKIGLDYSPFESIFLPDFLKGFEPTSFNFIINYLGNYVSQIANNKIDMALVSSDLVNNAVGIRFDQLLAGKFLLMFNSDNNLRFKKTVNLAELKNYRVLVLFTDQTYPSLFKLNQLLYQKLDKKNVKAVDNYFLMYNYVLAAERVVAIIPNFAINPAQKGISYRQLNYYDDFSYGLAYSSLRERDPLIPKIMANLRQSIKSDI